MLASIPLTLAAATGIPVVVYILGALLTGGLAPLVYQALQNWRKGPIQDQAIIAGTVTQQLGGMKDLLDEYRIELEVAKRQLEDYRQQLGDVTSRLAEAQVRISHLETRLENAREQREAIESQLNRLRDEYSQLARERESLDRLTQEMRQRISQLGVVTGTAVDRDPPLSGGGDIAP